MTAVPRPNDGVLPGTSPPSGAPDPAWRVGVSLLVVGEATASAALALVEACSGVQGRRGLRPEGDPHGRGEALEPALSARLARGVA